MIGFSSASNLYKGSGVQGRAGLKTSLSTPSLGNAPISGGGPGPSNPPFDVKSITNVNPPEHTDVSTPHGVLRERFEKYTDALKETGLVSANFEISTRTPNGQTEITPFCVDPHGTLAPTTPFNIASVGKMMTSVAVYQLAEKSGGVSGFF